MDSTAHTFFLHLLIILVTARLFAEAAGWARLPSVVGELLAGIVLGPTALNWIEPDRVIRMLAEIGIILLLFEAGLDTDSRQLVRAGAKAAAVAVGGFVWPFGLGFAVAYYGFGRPLLESLFIGGTLTATSIGITLRVLADLHRQQSHEARLVLGAAVIDDVLGVVLLALLYQFALEDAVSLANAGRLLGFIALFFLLAPVVARGLSLIIQRMERYTRIPGLIPTAVVSLVLGLAWLSKEAGAPELLGGFAAGLALSSRFYLPFDLTPRTDPAFTGRIEAQTRPIVHLFVPIFFVVVGLSLDLRAIDWHSPFVWELSLALIGVALVGKLLGAVFIREPWPTRFAVGLAMVPRGEVGLVFAELGRSSELLNNEVYAVLIMVIALTTLGAPLLLKGYFHWLGRRSGEAAAPGPVKTTRR
ncbi:Kef-type K+ transport system, membrane component KefB [Methylomagnum ishizawai]|uniref:Kef-type K+ transport system, membrane component KefB n=1 Tax=Methylomagnum ishizawai TaxID=1760988 RepID=A0A1Y6D444_9GAMM|nr:cation:proton antiporter [Methylomagnum ishizawai]SMF97376.1 Kef-type K+ transport system, membrane component KefB [Methylomagnum ishizawai]